MFIRWDVWVQRKRLIDYIGLTLADGSTVASLLAVAVKQNANDRPAVTFGCWAGVVMSKFMGFFSVVGVSKFAAISLFSQFGVYLLR